MIVCSSVIPFVSVNGDTLIFASTNTFVAAPLPPGPALPEVERVRLTPPTVSATEAFPVTVPALAEVNVSVHWPLR